MPIAPKSKKLNYISKSKQLKWFEKEDNKKGRWTKGVNSRFYNTAKWVKLRNRFIKEFPICRSCEKIGITTPGREVDHVIPIRIDSGKMLDWNNLQTLCVSCHRSKTSKERHAYALNNYGAKGKRQ